MTVPLPRNIHQRLIGWDAGAGVDKTTHTLFLPHKPNCKLTKLTDGQVRLHKLGLFPVRCATCGDMMPAEGVQP